MEIEFEIPIQDSFFYVNLEGFPTSQNDSFSHEFGIMSYEARMIMDEDPVWNQKLYTDQQNDIIESYILKNYDSIEKTFVKEYILENLQ